MPAPDRDRLAAIYYDELKADKTNGAKILDQIVAAQSDPAAQFQWKLKALDFQLFELGNIDAARQIAATLPLNESSLIALGDIERMAGNTDLATQYYAKAQGLLPGAVHAGPTPFTGFAHPTATPVREGAIVITTATTQDADWRRRARCWKTAITPR